ncbi:MAG: 50S ribosomal protein L10 [Anaerolineales bacterium]|nr:50S ribosomal protein L10 [Chloroflexota bacterium]MDP2995785.1 50S ribosomal protein L10 [Anaerolineales bacterium]
MSKSKAQKETILTQYMEWVSKSQAVVLVEYSGLKTNNLDAIRAKIREAGGEFHIVKNTLAKLALEKAGFKVPADYAEKSTAIGFAFSDPAGFAKALTEATKGMEAVKIKGGFMGAVTLKPAEVKALASLPPLPVIRAQLLGILQAPASKLVRILAEPGRQVAYVVKAFSEKAAPIAA